MAWSMTHRLDLAVETSPGRNRQPAASALVQPAGRRAFDRRFQIAPEPACQVEPTADVVQLVQPAGPLSSMSMWRSEPFSILGLAGIG